ncbi:AMP-binding protein [Lyngbya sp. CCY1209]|uniref:AMP-dependent synthetase/ligase n=1 Tax=Lyngbya sp. CCY1209 TaxID=2886103 RepID=UPI002D20432E|nr:AMP-binding protein [Lyngbya sp. CCY1209]MEB3886914.1 AMP-binding protein [Lyngbya sp. CCY1209]
MIDTSTFVAQYQSAESLPQIWPILAQTVPQEIALWDPHAQPEVRISYGELWTQIQQFAAGLQRLGVEPIADDIPPRIALFADDSPRWMIADQGIMTAGAADAVRGATADPEELAYILQNSGSTGLVVENLALLDKLHGAIQDLPIRFVILLSDEEPEPKHPLALPVFNFSQLMAQGEDLTLTKPATTTPDDLATLLYTSGTTGKPKGVMLTHRNFLHQLTAVYDVLQATPGEIVLSILPTWHSLGRMGQYYCLSQGTTLVYTNIRYFKRDLREFKPHYMVSVPRIWESIHEAAQKQFRDQPPTRQKLVNFFFSASDRYIRARRVVRGLTLSSEKKGKSQSAKMAAQLQMLLWAPIHALGDQLVYRKVREAVGGDLKLAISGGGSLAMHLENFYEIVGIELLVGYGLTETAPVLTARRLWHNLRGSAGKPIPHTEIRIIDPDTRQTCEVGHKGLVLARGPQVMAGYFKNPEATQKAIDPEGWFDTGDLGWLTRQQDLVLTGRAKDTIVLTNGENIEPQPIEDACARSPYIDQIVLVGQDQKSLGALIVPNVDALKQWAGEQNVTLDWPEGDGGTAALESQPIQDLFRRELNREVKNRPSYRPDDRIGPFRLILEPFSIENGMLTQTLKIKRPVVMERYRDMINEMY